MVDSCVRPGGPVGVEGPDAHQFAVGCLVAADVSHFRQVGSVSSDEEHYAVVVDMDVRLIEVRPMEAMVQVGFPIGVPEMVEHLPSWGARSPWCSRIRLVDIRWRGLNGWRLGDITRCEQQSEGHCQECESFHTSFYSAGSLPLYDGASGTVMQ